VKYRNPEDLQSGVLEALFENYKGAKKVLSLFLKTGIRQNTDFTLQGFETLCCLKEKHERLI